MNDLRNSEANSTDSPIVERSYWYQDEPQWIEMEDLYEADMSDDQISLWISDLVATNAFLIKHVEELEMKDEWDVLSKDGASLMLELDMIAFHLSSWLDCPSWEQQVSNLLNGEYWTGVIVH